MEFDKLRCVTCSRSSNLSTATLTRIKQSLHIKKKNHLYSQSNQCVLDHPNNEDCYVLRRVSKTRALNASDEDKTLLYVFILQKPALLGNTSCRHLA